MAGNTRPSRLSGIASRTWQIIYIEPSVYEGTQWAVFQANAARRVLGLAGLEEVHLRPAVAGLHPRRKQATHAD